VSDTSADAGVVQSRVQLERLVAEDELSGRTISGFAAPSVGLRSLDLDGVTLERLDLRGADGDESRLERAELKQSDLRTSQWRGALWHRVRAKDCDLTELDFTGAQLLRCELGPVRMARVSAARSSLKRPSISKTASLLLRKTSRHMVGSEAAMRVKSRKPPAENLMTSDEVTCASSSADSRGLSGTYTPPANQTPNSAATMSGPFGSITPTACPGRRPAARNTPASASARARSSDRVISSVAV